MIAVGNSLLVFVNERNDDNLSIEDQFDEVCDPMEAGIRSGIPNIEPKRKVKSTFVNRYEQARPTCTVLFAVRSRPVDMEQPSNQARRTSIPPSLNGDQIQNSRRTT